MKTIFESAIARGGYDLTVMLRRIDSYHIEGKLTDEERDELYAAARAGAQTSDSVAVMIKLQELDRRVKALEDKAKTEENPGESEGEGEGETVVTYPDYVAGKWYYNGDIVMYNGTAYKCIAPDKNEETGAEAVVCTWSPDEYPAYWEQVAE